MATTFGRNAFVVQQLQRSSPRIFVPSGWQGPCGLHCARHRNEEDVGRHHADATSGLALVQSRHGDLLHRERSLDPPRKECSLVDDLSAGCGGDGSKPAHNPAAAGDRVFVYHKAANPWSNENKQGNRLDWSGLHAKAREFLFTESALQQLNDDYAAYAQALIEGEDLSPWHDRADWRRKADAARRSPATVFNAQQRAVARMAATVRDIVRGASGQQVVRTVKNKELKFSNLQMLERYIDALVRSQDGTCALTGIPLQFDGEHDDTELLCSLDRINSDGHYEEGNFQVVCWFVNRWKNDGDDAEFRRLIALVRNSNLAT